MIHIDRNKEAFVCKGSEKEILADVTFALTEIAEMRGDVTGTNTEDAFKFMVAAVAASGVNAIREEEKSRR
ncbi:MAG: hypothetical protein ACI4RK_07310 [Oscillospiraceae bacterium]